LAKKKPSSSKKGGSKKSGSRRRGKKGSSGRSGPEKAASTDEERGSHEEPVAVEPTDGPEVASVDGPAHGRLNEVEPAAIDRVEAEPAEEVVSAAASDEPEIVDIDLDEEMDDAARSRLVAEALEYVAREEGTSPEGASSDEGEQVLPEGGTSPETSGESDEEETDASEPLIGPQALLALSELHAEGLASVPEELVLDLGEAATPEERDRLLAAAMAHAEMQEAIYRVPTKTYRVRHIKFGIAAVIALVAVVVSLRPPAFVVPVPPPSLSVADEVRGVRLALLLQAQQIEAHRVETGRLPTSLAEVAFELPDVRFIRTNSRSYQLVAFGSDGERVVFDSTVPSPDFGRLRDEWAPTRGSR
jgi:hypothetical protein